MSHQTLWNQWIHINFKHIKKDLRNDKKFIGISKKWYQTKPLSTVAQNQNMGNKMEKGNWQNNWMGNMAMG